MDDELEALDTVNRFGAVTDFVPKVDSTLSDLVPVAGGDNPATRRAAVLKTMSSLGSADGVALSAHLQPSGYTEGLEKHGVQFFADPTDKEAVQKHLEGLEGEEKVEMGEVEDALKKVILDQAVLGKHEAPKFATDTAGIVKSLYLRSNTYRQQDVALFEKKLMSVLSKVKAAAPKPAAPAKKGKAAKAKSA